MTVSADFEAMLRMELTFLTDEQARIAARMDAVEVLLGGRPPEPDTAPVGADVPVKATTPPKGARKSLRANLSDEAIKEIRNLAKYNSYNSIAEEYKVSRATIGNIVQRKGCYG